MDSPIWSNDLLYVKELIIIIIISVAMIVICTYVSKRDDRKRALRTARMATQQGTDVTHEATESHEDEQRP